MVDWWEGGEHTLRLSPATPPPPPLPLIRSPLPKVQPRIVTYARTGQSGFTRRQICRLAWRPWLKACLPPTHTPPPPKNEWRIVKKTCENVLVIGSSIWLLDSGRKCFDRHKLLPVKRMTKLFWVTCNSNAGCEIGLNRIEWQGDATVQWWANELVTGFMCVMSACSLCVSVGTRPSESDYICQVLCMPNGEFDSGLSSFSLFSFKKTSVQLKVSLRI